MNECRFFGAVRTLTAHAENAAFVTAVVGDAAVIPCLDTAGVLGQPRFTFAQVDEVHARAPAKAAALGYAALAITDHGPAMPDAPHMWHFANQTALPLVLHGVAMMYGAEANVMDTNGGLDFAQSRLRALDWVVASIHSPCIPGLLTEKEATRLWLAVAENPYVDCIGHSEQQNYRYDYDLVTKAFAKNHKVVELNGNSVNVRRDGIPNMKLLLAACLKNGCHIALDTDAHSTTQLQGNMPPLLAMLEEMQFPQELVVNATRQNLVNELKLHGRICAEYIGGEIL